MSSIPTRFGKSKRPDPVENVKRDIIQENKDRTKKDAHIRLTKAIVEQKAPDDFYLRPKFNSAFLHGGTRSVDEAYEDLAVSLLDKVEIDIELDIKVSDRLTRRDVENKMREMIAKAEKERK